MFDIASTHSSTWVSWCCPLLRLKLKENIFRVIAGQSLINLTTSTEIWVSFSRSLFLCLSTIGNRINFWSKGGQNPGSPMVNITAYSILIYLLICLQKKTINNGYCALKCLKRSPASMMSAGFSGVGVYPRRKS